jgi:hypothetical protein
VRVRLPSQLETFLGRRRGARGSGSTQRVVADTVGLKCSAFVRKYFTQQNGYNPFWQFFGENLL